MIRCQFKLLSLAALLFLWGFSWAWGEDYLVRNWQTEDGLPDNTVTAIQQTGDGYLWIGTFNGLVRFDGVQFKVFDSVNTPALPSSRILSLSVDKEDTLWIGMEGGGLARFKDDRFTPFFLGERHASEDITSLFQETNGTVWANVGGHGVAQIQPSNLDFVKVYELTNGVGQEMVNQLTADPAARDWIMARNDILTFRGGSWFSRPSQVPPSGTEIIAVQRSHNGAAWIAHPRSLSRLDVDGSERVTYPWGGEFSSALVTTLLEDHTGKIWVGTLNNGLFDSTAPGVFAPVISTGPLSQNVISAVFEDRDGAIWVGSYRGGLFRIKPRHVTTMMPPGAGEVNVQTVCVASDGAVWLGTGGAGLYRYLGDKFTRFTEASGLSNQHVCAVFEDSRTNLWVGTWGGLFLREGENFHLVSQPLIPERVLALYEDRSGDLWVGGYGGIVRKHGTNWTLFTTANGLSHPDVRVMAEDREGNLWVGTAGGGLDCLRDGQFIHYDETKGFAPKMVLALHVDHDNTLWIGTIGVGLTAFKDGKFTTYTTQDGLADNVIGGIIEDKLGNLWLSSQNGILRVSIKDLTHYERGRTSPLPCFSLSVGDGLSTPMCSGAGQPVAARAADGQLWVPNMKAVAVINPALMQPHNAIPSVVIEEVSVDGKDFPPQFDVPLQVPYGRSRFEFHYTALGLPVPEAVRFRYRLTGFDKEWVDAGVRRYAYYGQLPPGRYDFRVMAAGSDGIWHEAPTPLGLVVVPHLWELRWFQVLAGMVFVAVLGGAISLNERRKLRRRLERAEMQQALENERRRISRDLHDDIGARLTEIALMGEVARRSAHTTDAMENQLGGMTYKVRELINAMEEVIWTVNPRNDSLVGMATFLCDYTERFLSSAQIGCRLEVAENLPKITLGAQVRHNLLLAVKEALNNAVKHAQANTVWLRIHMEDNSFRVEVADDGRGLEPQDSGRIGNGLQNMRARMESVQGSVEFLSMPGSGTRVIFKMPLNLVSNNIK